MARFPVLHGLAAVTGSSPALYSLRGGRSNPTWLHGMGLGLAVP